MTKKTIYNPNKSTIEKPTRLTITIKKSTLQSPRKISCQRHPIDSTHP